MRIVSLARFTFVAVVTASALVGCSGIGCDAHAETPIGAVTGFMNVLPDANDPGDICQYVSEGWAVSQDELEVLKSELSPYETADVSFVEGDQMAGDITVDLVLDGVVEYSFRLNADDDTRWALDLGELIE